MSGDGRRNVMIDRALRRAIFASLVLAAAALLFDMNPLRPTFAAFNGETTNNASSFAGGWVAAASAASATASGTAMNLAWTVGTPASSFTGQTVKSADNNANPNCSGAAFTTRTTFANTTTASYVHSGAATAGTNGHWFCYQIVDTTSAAWTASTQFAAQVGLVTAGITIGNGGGTANTIQRSDTITVTFNQKTSLAAGTFPTCVISTTTIIIGDTTSTNCNTAATTDLYNFGKLVVSGATFASTIKLTTTTIAVSAAAPWTATVTLNAGTNVTSAISGTPTWTFTPAASIATSVTPTIAICATGSCLPTTKTSF
jgi:hypothetical protein